jgi:hypothetical protein
VELINSFNEGRPMEQTFSLTDAASLVGVSYTRANIWSREGLVPLISSQGQGRGYGRRVDIRGVLAMRLIRRCAQIGIPAAAAKSIADVLSGLTPVELRRLVQRGRRFLFLGADVPGLLTAKALPVARNPEFCVIIDLAPELNEAKKLMNKAPATMACI